MPDSRIKPDVWETASVSAIFKKSEKFKVSNCRPVSLTCISYKMFEPIIFSNMMRPLDKHDILTYCQHGFRLRRSCETQLLTLRDELIKSLGNGRQHDLAVLDFSKAFDRVPHERLLIKLEHYGIWALRKHAYKYIENFNTKTWKFSDKKFWYFSYFCSKHRLCVLVRTASMRRF